MTIRELEALVAEYEAKATKYSEARLVIFCDCVVSYAADGWGALFEGAVGCPDYRAGGADNRRTPQAALRAAYRDYCKEVRDA